MKDIKEEYTVRVSFNLIHITTNYPHYPWAYLIHSNIPASCNQIQSGSLLRWVLNGGIKTVFSSLLKTQESVWCHSMRHKRGGGAKCWCWCEWNQGVADWIRCVYFFPLVSLLHRLYSDFKLHIQSIAYERLPQKIIYLYLQKQNPFTPNTLTIEDNWQKF